MGSPFLKMSVIRLPQSPLKVLQPSSKANQNLMKPQILNTCLPDSTDENQELPFKKHHHSVKKMQTPSVSRRNARERYRVKQVNNGFSTLRTHIPHLKNKTSKVDTLRAAVDYIKALRNLIGEPMNDQELHQGPVLITEVEEKIELDESNMSDLNESMDHGRPISVASDSSATELPSIVYSLPPPLNPTIEYVEHPASPTPSSTSSGSGRGPEVDSTGTHLTFKPYLDDIQVDLQNWADWTSSQ